MAVTVTTISSLGTSQFQDTVNANAAIVVKGSAGNFFAMVVDNTLNASVVYTKLYDSAGAVVVGTTNPDYIFKTPASTKATYQFIGSATPGGLVTLAGLQVATLSSTGAGTQGTTSPASAVTVIIVFS